jgi:hypothetical protein
MFASCGSKTYLGGLVLITGRLMSGAAAGVIIIGLSFVTQVCFRCCTMLDARVGENPYTVAISYRTLRIVSPS